LEISQYLGKRQNPNGKWNVKVKWRNQWIPKEFCYDLSRDEFDDLIDSTNPQHLRELDIAKGLNTLSVQHYQRNFSNSSIDSLLDDVPIETQEKKTRKRSNASSEELDGDFEDNDYESKKKKQKKTNFEIVEKKVKWYATYHGAIAYAILKAKGWDVRKDGYLDVRLENDKKKFGGSVYDWDILWLGMKLIPKVVIDSLEGVNATRKLIKNHDKIRFYLTDWRKKRPTSDSELKEIFNVTKVTSDLELTKFMNEHKNWTEEEEERFLSECSARAGIDN
jgi:hypothetical protein